MHVPSSTDEPSSSSSSSSFASSAPGSAAGSAARPHELTPALTLVFAAACGLAVANIYYAQPLIAPVAASLHLPESLAGIIMTLTQLGYGTGLLLLVPLADVVENRRLVICALAGLVCGLLGVASATGPLTFLLSAFIVGLCAVATQVLVPFASHLAPDATRGKVVGNIMAGLLAGVMLARPLASIVSAAAGWRTVFLLSAGAMVGLGVALWRLLPERRPETGTTYRAILASLPPLVRTTPLLRRRAFYQGMMFAGFNVFWTGVPLLLARVFGLGQHGIAWFALAGAAGALCAPLAGRLADRGYTRPATGAAIATAVLAFGIAAWSAHAHSLTGLVIAALLLDGAVQICQVLSLRSLFMLAPASRGRINGLFLTFVFLCGATGSGLAAAVFTLEGWTALTLLGAGLGTAALLAYATEWRRGSAAAAPCAAELSS